MQHMPTGNRNNMVNGLLGEKSAEAFNASELIAASTNKGAVADSAGNATSLENFVREYSPQSASLLKDIAAVNNLATMVDSGITESSQFVNAYKTAMTMSDLSQEKDVGSGLSLIS